MQSQVSVISVFLSSPSDVAEERGVVLDVAESLNRVRGRREGFRLEVLSWERDVRPSIGIRPQAHITASIGNYYDIFVGVICAKFGTPTGTHNSGTEEEFEIALARKLKDHAALEILFYFKDPRSSVSEIDGAQYALVDKFRRRVQELGVYNTFSNIENFKTDLLLHFSSAIDAILSRATTTLHQTFPSDTSDLAADQKHLEIAMQEDSDLGILDILELSEEKIASFTENTDVLSTATSRLGSRIEERTAELNSLSEVVKMGGQLDRKAQKSIAIHTSKNLFQFSEELAECIPRLASDFGIVSELMRQAVLISREDGLEDQKGALELDKVLDILKLTITETALKTGSLAESISKAPRMVRELNVAKRVAVERLKDFETFSVNAVAQIEAVQAHLRAND